VVPSPDRPDRRVGEWSRLRQPAPSGPVPIPMAALSLDPPAHPSARSGHGGSFRVGGRMGARDIPIIFREFVSRHALAAQVIQ
jgi:hypothetical protein